MVNKTTPPAAPLQISLKLEPELLARIDGAARALGLSRSGFLRMAAIKALPKKEIEL